MICGDVDKLYVECMENLIKTIQEKMNCERNYAIKIIDNLKINNKIIVEKWM